MGRSNDWLALSGLLHIHNAQWFSVGVAVGLIVGLVVTAGAFLTDGRLTRSDR